MQHMTTRIDRAFLFTAVIIAFFFNEKLSVPSALGIDVSPSTYFYSLEGDIQSRT